MAATPSLGNYGRRRFDKDKSLGHRIFGKTTVDCGLLASKSQWGSLEQDPAGLLRLTLNIHEPAEYKLLSTEIHLCFLHFDVGPSPDVTEHVYPNSVCGPLVSQRKTRNFNFEPSIEAMNTSIGGIGVHNTAEWSKTFQWLLRGSRLPDEHSLYSIAEWIWQANGLNKQSELGRAFQLAVIIKHAEPRIKVKVSIKGKLQQHGKRWSRYRLRNFGHSPEAVPIELFQDDAELESIVKTLAVDIARLNLVSISEQTTPSSVDVLASDVSLK